MTLKIIARTLFLTTALSTALPAYAQTVGSAADVPPAAAATSDNGGLGDIVVTARRDAENLQNVPVSVQVVTGSELQKLSITSADEVSKLAPGLTLVNAGAATVVTLRGVTWQPGSGTPATPIYFNEVPFDPASTIVSLFDVGQIEVLRGPQGTTRGAPSISGAVTITTRKPDLQEFGGYVQGLYGSGDHKDVQGAINAPIIKGVLAVRLAANIEDSHADRVRSVNSSINPRYKDRTYRGTVLFKPTDKLTLGAMYSHRISLSRTFAQVVGTGSPGFAPLGIPANFNGPALTQSDRKSVQDEPNLFPQNIDLLTVNASWEVLGHRLSYNYGRQWNRNKNQFNATDTANFLPGFESYSAPYFLQTPSFRTHEILLSSLPDDSRPFDYDIGWFSKRSSGDQKFLAPVYLPGAFGAPFASLPGQVTTPNPRYVLNALVDAPIGQVFDSFHGNIKAHIDHKTELSAGFAILRDRVPVSFAVDTPQAAIAFPRFLPPAAGGCPSPLLPDSPDYGAAYCEFTQPATTGVRSSFNPKYSAAIYNFSLSRRFSDSILVYATTGSSFRSGLPAIGNNGLPSGLLIPKPESAKSYEIGVKTSFGNILRVDADIFQLDYKNQLTTFEGVQYFSSVPGAGVQTANVGFYRNIDSRVRGLEVAIAAKPLQNLSLGANISYSKIKSQGGSIPCNSSTPLTADNPINFCDSPKGQTLNQVSPFQTTINGDYELPLTDSIAGYFRFNVNYKGKNPNFGNFRLADGSYTSTKAYALVDLYAGLTGNKSGWDLGVYAKNVFNKQVELHRYLATNTVYALYAAPSGYNGVQVSLPREVGVSLRYAFGSR